MDEKNTTAAFELMPIEKEYPVNVDIMQKLGMR